MGGYSLIWASGMYCPEGYDFQSFLDINKVSILILVINRVWFCTLVLNWVCCLEEATFSGHK